MSSIKNVFKGLWHFLISLLFLNLIGTILFSFGLSNTSSYKFEQTNIKSFLELVLILICNPWLLVVGGVIFLIIGNYRLYRENVRFKKIEKDNSDLNSKINTLEDERKNLRNALTSTQEEVANLKNDIYKARRTQVEDWLKGLFKQFKLTTEDRISIYCVVEDVFHMVHRYSDNPSLCSTHFHQYPMEKGVIYQAYCHNKCYDNQCPQFQDDNEGYYKYMEERYSYVRYDIESITMKSCRYLGLSIKQKGRNIGVVLFESTNKSNLAEKMVKGIESYCKDYEQYLCGYVNEYITDINTDNTRRKSLSNSSNDQEIYKELKGGNK